MTDNEPSADSRVPRPQPSGAIRRRDRALLIGLAVVVVAFAAISITVNALRPDVPTTSNSATVDPRVQDSDFVVHLGETAVAGRTQEQLIGLGRSSCASLDSGRSKPDTTAELVAKGLTDAQAKDILTAAIEAYCPTHR